MKQHHTLHIQMHNEPSVLPRVLLAFSRRRLRIKAMQLVDLHAGKAADVQIDLDCEAEHARDVAAQLRAIVEVTNIWSEPVLDTAALTPVDSPRAAA
ncbi:MAG: acetolactate synthase small subunit [Gammaproteobacteria bacterium]|jgi:acetolactate synthase small subunit